MEVEHFLPKKHYPNLVVDWDNLLPSCKRCNTNKGEHDPNNDYIINPCRDDPKTHITMRNYRLKANDQIGQNTIDVLYLNDTERLVQCRFLIGNEAQDSIEKIADKLRDYHHGVNVSTRRKNMIVNGLKSLLRQGLPQKDYSATVATIILNDENFCYCKDILIELDFWDDELSDLEKLLSINCLNLV
ncbi:HNH endonuclease [Alkalihalobacillus deserti]|uniref:HNH endonuclease n=1 Tax=Alkalihalobacillus deserti TaxID=2879466 RepID=UPI001D13D7CF|nr:HNH endonuclease [Alkalihalobacillus deserti]